MKKIKKENLKKFILKCLYNKDANNLLITLLYIPFLIVGFTTNLKWLMLVGGFGLVLVNTIIKKVVRNHIDITQYNFNNDKKTKKGEK